MNIDSFRESLQVCVRCRLHIPSRIGSHISQTQLTGNISQYPNVALTTLCSKHTSEHWTLGRSLQQFVHFVELEIPEHLKQPIPNLRCPTAPKLSGQRLKCETSPRHIPNNIRWSSEIMSNNSGMLKLRIRSVISTSLICQQSMRTISGHLK